MQNGFVKVKAVSFPVRLNDAAGNASRMIEEVLKAEGEGVSLLVFPELCLTGATVGDMAAHESLLSAAENALFALAKATENTSVLFFVGLPVRANGGVYNVAAGLSRGKILGFVPKRHHLSFGVRAGEKQFIGGENAPAFALFGGKRIPMGNIAFTAKNYPALKVAAAVGKDAFYDNAPLQEAFLNGANFAAILSAEEETIEKPERIKLNLSFLTQTYGVCAVYAEAGEGESVTDGVFGGVTAVYEKGLPLCESQPFGTGVSLTEADTTALLCQKGGASHRKSKEVFFTARVRRVALSRKFLKHPFLPQNGEVAWDFSRRVLTLQAQALAKRMAFTRAKRAVVGLSGGLDSTLALIVAAKAAKILNMPPQSVLCVTMPCFGTTGRTYQNALSLANGLGAELKEIPIAAAVKQHFQDIGHSETQTDVTFENSQARERTQVLMDLANRENGLVVGTGDLSELALGWATYNGDHMSNYAVNASIPKTLVRTLVESYAKEVSEPLRSTLLDILATPVSPELLPAEGKENDQKTEDIVGPYELHDFFLYCFLNRGYPPETVLRVATYTFQGEYEEDVIKHWLSVFFRRFFTQQFKRSCLPEGVAVGTVGISPRGFLSLPGDGYAINLNSKE